MSTDVKTVLFAAASDDTSEIGPEIAALSESDNDTLDDGIAGEVVVDIV